MKKQKQAEPKSTQETISGTGDLLWILSIATNQSESTKQLQQLSRTDSELVIVTNSIEEIQNRKEVAERIEKGKCKVVAPAALAQTVKESNAKWLFFASEQTNVSAVLSAFQTNRKSFTPGEIQVGVMDKPAETFVQKLKRIGHNFLAQLLLPVPLKDYTRDVLFFPKDHVSDCFQTVPKNVWQLLSSAIYHEADIHTFKLSQKEQSEAVNHLGAIVKTAFTSRFNWFIKEPLQGLFAPATPGNAPISRLLFVVLVAVGFFLMPMLSFDYGITWDAKRHNLYGYEMLKYFESDGADKAALNETSSMNEFRYYGEHFNVISAWINTHIKPWGEFETRHFLNAIYGFLAMLFAALAAKEIGGWRAGSFAFAFILLSPIFFGHSMNNPTDIPFAAGCAMALYYLLKVLRNLPAPKFTYLMWCGAGIGMAIGSRIGGIVFYAYTGLFMGLSWLFYMRSQGTGKAFKVLSAYIISGVTIIVVAHLIGISLWPFGQEAPLTNWYVALKKSTSSEFFTFNHEIFEGTRMYMANVPWYYLPKFILINSPLFILVGFVLLVLGCFAWKKVFGNKWVLIGVVIFVFVFPIVYAEVQSMYYYNGWRHYLFTYPPLIVLTALGWETWMRLFKPKAVAWTLSILAIGLLVLPLKWMYENHPNEVVYYNELVGGTKGAYGNYELDYYSNSCREAAEWIAHQEPNKKLLVAINNEPLTGAYYAQRINPNIEFRWVREYEEQKPNWDYAIFTSRTYSKKELSEGGFPPKGTVYTVNVEGVPIAAVVKREVDYMPKGYEAFAANQLDTSLYFFEKACEWNDKDEEAFRMKGVVLRSLRRPEEANSAFMKAIALYPENYMAYSDLGLTYAMYSQKLDSATLCFKKALELKINYTDAYYYLAKLELSRNNPDAGVKYLETALKKGGNGVAQIYFELGDAYYKTRRFTKAEETLQMFLTLQPNNANGYGLLANIYATQGKNREAEYCKQRYLELGGR